MSGLRARLGAAAYHTGVLPALHRRRNGETLTVVMFHRVLPDGSPELAMADPGYTVTDGFFAGCLRFFRSHYQVVSLDAVMDAHAGRTSLPPHALLISFDDGWADNLTTAMPLLQQYGLPAVVFVATDAVTDPTPVWWQDQLGVALRRGQGEALCRALGVAAKQPDMLCRLLVRMADMPEAERAGVMAELQAMPGGRQMVDADGLMRLVDGRMAVAAHGASHLPLTLVDSPLADLKRARQTLARLLPHHPPAQRALSLPHGRSNSTVLSAARAAGFEFIFTSEPRLNAVPGGRLHNTVLGRIEMPAGQLSDESGMLAPDKLARWLFTRPIDGARA